MTAPNQSRTVHGSLTMSRLLVFIAAVLMFLGAIVEMGASLLGLPSLAWVFFGLCAWLLSMVL